MSAWRSRVGAPPRSSASPARANRRSCSTSTGCCVPPVALSSSTGVLVLDEPTVGLDASGRAEFYAYLRRARQERGVTIVLVSHDMAEVATLAERLFVLHEGRLVLQGPPREIFAQGERLREWGL